MDRGMVSVDGETYPVGEPFMVVATQNPVDFEGTFPLPESQMDRFLVRLEMGYPDFKTELSILQGGHRHYDHLDIESVLTQEEIIEVQEKVPEVFVEESVLDYLLRLITSTRTESEFRSGISTRGSLALKVYAQAIALYQGREFVIPEDVQEAFVPVCAHRLNLCRPTSDLLEERRVIQSVLRRLIDTVPRPRV